MRRGKVLNNESGFIKFIIVMLVLACIIYMGVKLGIPYYKYSALKSDAIRNCPDKRRTFP